MKSKTALFRFLATRFNKPGVNMNTHGISNETYGPKSMIYFWSITEHWGVTRKEFERILGDEGFKCNRRYGIVAGRDPFDATEVQVSYFKGYHWDE